MESNPPEQIPSRNIEDVTIETKGQKITLTSRTLDDKTKKDKKSLDEVSCFVDEFEKFVMSGFTNFRRVLKDLKQESFAKEEAYKAQISQIEECNAENDVLQERNSKLEEELNEVKNRLKVKLGENQDTIHKLSNMEKKHRNYLESVALSHRERKVARKVIEKWKHKLGSRSRINLIMEENKYLKKELHKCQNDAKKAFLRSANTLNNEALSMFQTASNRRLSRKSPEEFGYLDQSGSVASSTNVSDCWSDKSVEGGDLAALRHHHGKQSTRDKRPQSESSERRNTGHDKENSLPYGSAEDLHSEDSRSYNRFKNSCKVVPDDCKQKEKTEAEKYSRKNNSRHLTSDAWVAQNAYHARSQMHVCCCQPLSARSEKCPKCPIKSHNVTNLSTFKKPPNSVKQRNIAFASLRHMEKANVMYNPTGTAVVIEKHLSH